MAQQSVQSILDFWFGELNNQVDYPADKARMWFVDGATYDEQIINTYGVLHEQACQGELQHWESAPHSKLALILLLDQFSRHIYRNQARSFAQDEKALTLVQQGLERGFDKELYFVQRKFFYMPLMHAEDIDIQTQSVEMFTQLQRDVPEEQKQLYARTLSFAQSHHYVIEKFGRFPELNEMLSRTSTTEEIAFLATGKYRFL